MNNLIRARMYTGNKVTKFTKGWNAEVPVLGYVMNNWLAGLMKQGVIKNTGLASYQNETIGNQTIYKITDDIKVVIEQQ